MNIPEYIRLARKILNEDAGSEGMVYKIVAKTPLKAMETDMFTITEVLNEEEGNSAIIKFAYPQDYGFALATIKETFEDIDLISLSLVY